MTTIVTHDAKFHADDVFAVAALLLIYPDATVVRSREQSVIDAADIAVDVGGIYEPARLRFDHHQGGAGVRENGIPYASFGLVWKEFGERIAGGREEALVVDRKLVAPVDAIDNGVALSVPQNDEVGEYRLDDLFGSFVDYTDISEALFETFMKLVRFAQDVVHNEVRSAALRVASRTLVEEAYVQASDKRVIVLSRSMPWAEVLLMKPEPAYVIFEVAKDKWYVRGVPLSTHSFEVRQPFPTNWAGKTGEELEKESGVPGALFAHKGRYLAVASSREAATKLAEVALNS